MIDFKLANVLIEPDDFTESHQGIYFNTDAQASFDRASSALVFQGQVDFFSYFNAVSWCKWTRYASLDNLWLHLELSGDAVSVIQAVAKMDDQSPSTTDTLLEVPASPSPQSFDVELNVSDETALTSFVLATTGSASLRSAYYYTKIDEDRIRPVKLALATTTFKKEEFILRNVAEVKKQIFASDEPIAKGFHMFVVDNGRTLNVDEVSDDNVTVIPNANVGGAGGFARGMMAALDIDATHVLLMDDDVRVMPESFIRTFNLLSLRNDDYENAFINGAMLSLEEPNLQYEDVAHVRNSGAYDRIKKDLYIDTAKDVIKNESIDVEVEHAYGAWWYSCIPTSAIREHGLPLPVFVRCDDVEFGIRCNPTYMCMNGICVWHASFDGRFRASVDCYQYTRNFLIMMAIDDIASEKLFMLRLDRTLRAFLRALDYGSAELTLDGLEDYLKGPDFLAHADGEALMKSNGARNEKLVPLEEIDPAIMSQIDPDDGKFVETRTLTSKVIELIPIDAHSLPDGLLSGKPAAVYYHFGAYPGSGNGRRKTLVAIDHDQTHGNVRIRDKKRWKAIMDRYHALEKELADRGAAVRQEYRDARPWLTSRDFWEEYLKRNLENS